MQTTEKDQRLSMFTRFFAKLVRASQREKEAKQSKKLAIHPSFLDDFGA